MNRRRFELTDDDSHLAKIVKMIEALTLRVEILEKEKK